MGIVERINNVFSRKNVSSKLPYEAIKGVGDRKYQDRLVSGGYHDFWDDFSRKEVILNDSIGERVTLGFLKHVFEKLPKFAENDEVEPEYIMDDVRQAIDTLQLKPKFITSGVNIVVNGWSLIKWEPIMQESKKNQDGEEITKKTIVGLACKIFGYEECHPRYWRRFMQPQLANKISHYLAIYIPRPAGMEALYHTLTEEKYILRPSDPNFQHLTRLDHNYGLGYSRVQPIWDAITKLRERSDSDHFLNSNYMEVRYPQEWTKSGKGKKFVEKARKATRRRGLAVEAVQNVQTKEDTGLPSVQYRPWGQGAQGQPMDSNRASAYLDGEWLRLLVNLGYSQTWAIGTTAGQTTGSEINLTTDDRADIAEFALLEPVFKKILKKLAELGIMKAIGVSAESIKRLLAGTYRMLCWITWEYCDKAALQQAQLDHEMEMKKGGEEGKNAYNSRDKTRSNRWITVDGGTDDARHVWVGGGTAPQRAGSMTIAQWHDQEMEKIAKKFDYKTTKLKLTEIRDQYNTLNVSDEEFDKVMFKLYNKVQKKQIKSYTKDFQDFKGRRFIEGIERQIRKETKRIKDLNKDPKKVAKAKEDRKKGIGGPGEIRFLSLMKTLTKKQYVFEPKEIRSKMPFLEDDEIIADVYYQMQQVTGDIGAGEVDWERLEDMQFKHQYGTEQQVAYWEEREELQNGKISPIIIINTRTNKAIIGHRVRENLDIPMTPISSGTVSFAGVDDNDLVVRFPNYPPGGGDYKYHFGSNLDALDAYSGVGQGGGSYVWSHLRGRDIGPAYLTGNPTPGGTYASIVPYDISLGAMSQITPGATEQEPTSIEQIQEEQQQPYNIPEDMYNITTPGDIDVTSSQETIGTPGRVADPGSITGSKKTGPGRKRKRGRKPAGKGGSIIPYNPTQTDYNPNIYNEKFKAILNSASAMRRFAKTISTDHLPTGWGMKQDTPYKIRELIFSMVDHATRVNRVSFGNSIKAGHPYNYGGVDEYICPRDYKKNIGKIVPLGIYHNLDPQFEGDISLQDYQIIGTHEVLGWDEENGQELAKNEYDIEKINSFFEKRGEINWIQNDWLSKGLEPPISGAYSTNVKKIKNRHWQLKINLQSMSFVPEANCPWNICSFSPGEEKENSPDNKIDGQKVLKIVRQSNSYYLYLENGARILFQSHAGKYYAIPAQGTGRMELIQAAKSVPDSIRKFITSHNLRENKHGKIETAYHCLDCNKWIDTKLDNLPKGAYGLSLCPECLKKKSENK